MDVVCLDLEGVLVPEIWIEVAGETGIEDLRLTTRDIADYNELMARRLKALDSRSITLNTIQRIIQTMQPLKGALEFVRWIREQTQLIILSDTFDQFAAPLMKKLEYPTLFCNTLQVNSRDKITGYRLRQDDGKRRAVAAFKSMGLRVFSAGDSYNDLTMLRESDQGVLFRAPESIRNQNKGLPSTEEYSELMREISRFIGAA